MERKKAAPNPWRAEGADKLHMDEQYDQHFMRSGIAYFAFGLTFGSPGLASGTGT